MKEKRLIGFSSSALAWLKAEAKFLETSVSELVRRAVDAERRRVERQVAQEAKKDAKKDAKQKSQKKSQKR